MKYFSKMFVRVAIPCFLILLTSSVQGEKCGTYWHEEDDSCILQGNAYKTCNWKHGWKTVNCEKGTKCLCKSGFMTSLDSFEKATCTCAVIYKPSFPQTGVIRWKGTETVLEVHEGKTRVQPVHGVLYKDDAGYFLLKHDYMEEWYFDHHVDGRRKKMVKMMVPMKNGKFTKITRSNEGGCDITAVNKNEETLSALWDIAADSGWNEGVNSWKLLEHANTHNAHTQNWGGSTYTQYGSDYWFKVNWNLTVKKTSHGIIPTLFYRHVHEGDYKRTLNITYTYDTVNETLRRKLKDGRTFSAAFFHWFIMKYCPKR